MRRRQLNSNNSIHHGSCDRLTVCYRSHALWAITFHFTFVFGADFLTLPIGITETSGLVAGTSPLDVWLGSSGCIVAGMEGRLIDSEGLEVNAYDQPGELLIRSPSIALGYLRNDKADADTFINGVNGGGPNDRWMRTGDQAVFRKSPKGNDHVFIVDRIKELIKVKVRCPVHTTFGVVRLRSHPRVSKLHLQSSRRIF